MIAIGGLCYRTGTPSYGPDNKPLALWINLSVQHFPLSGEKPVVAPPGALTIALPPTYDITPFAIMVIESVFFDY